VRLDLDRHRTLGELIGQIFELFGLLLVIVPVDRRPILPPRI
jgi:hypothetical protein